MARWSMGVWLSGQEPLPIDSVWTSPSMSVLNPVSDQFGSLVGFHRFPLADPASASWLQR